MILKNTVRYLLGVFCQSLGIGQLIRKIYVARAKVFIKKFSPQTISAAWLRRSVTNEDFMPFWSDVDITVVIPDEQIGHFTFPKDFLIRDIQIIPESRFEEWKVHGGIRNRTMSSWLSLIEQKPLSLDHHFTFDKSKIAFDLAHEIYLLYWQLEKKINAKADPFIKVSRQKLLKELDRLYVYWETKKEDILFLPRKDIIHSKNESSYFNRMDKFWGELIKFLPEPLNSFSFEELIETESPNYYELNLTIRDKQVLLVKNPLDLDSLIIKYPHHFVVTKNLFNLIKPVGIQEQVLLNLLSKKNPYYFHFSRQRLACDLISAYLLNPENSSLIYYCLQNINNFSVAMTGKNTPSWHSIEENWNQKALLFSDSAQLAQMTKCYLEELTALG